MTRTDHCVRGAVLWLAAAGLASLSLPQPAAGAGVTIITHGLNSNIDDWVLAMAQAIPGYPGFPGTNFTCYEIYFATNGASYVPAFNRLRGSAPPATDSGEIVVKLDWRQLANNNYSTYQVASNVVPRLLDTNFIPELGGHALAEFPLHLVGHSRGGSLMCEISRLLGTNGVWVDHLTTLDPHPLNNDGFSDFPYTVVDAPARTYETVLFHDNYYQTLDTIFRGEKVAGAYTRQLTNLNGGYSGLAALHSDVHLWYHGTIDGRTPASDSVASITSAQRQTWWTAAESNGVASGFLYSRLGHGDRLGANQPAGAGRIRDGYNQRWDLGAGLGTNRTLLATNNGTWPSLITMGLTGTNFVAQGASAGATFSYQWAHPATTQLVVSICLDQDPNPYNGNEQVLEQVFVNGTGATNVGSVQVNFLMDGAKVPPGSYAVYARISDGGHTRYLYAPDLLTVVPNLQPPALDIARDASQQLQVGVTGVAGQRLVLQRSLDLRTWESFATNTLSSNRWVFPLVQTAGKGTVYRAVLSP
jgi:hypothetical protein